MIINMQLDLNEFEFGYFDKYFFNPFSFTFQADNIYLLAGANGSGKTSFLNALSLGFSKDITSCYRGNVVFRSEGVIKELSENISYFIQFFNDVFYFNSVKNEILQGRQESFYEDVVEEFKNFGFDFSHFEKKSPFDLDFTNQKKLSIFLTLINNKPILFLDEFDSRLSHLEKLFLCNYLKKIKRNKIIVVISHSNMVINEIADKIIYFNNKDTNLALFDSPKDYFNKLQKTFANDSTYYEINKFRIINSFMKK